MQVNAFIPKRPLYSRLIIRLSIQRLLPSMRILTFASVSTSIKPLLVNCDPWSVLNIFSAPYFANAFSNASTQNAAHLLWSSPASGERCRHVLDRSPLPCADLVRMRAVPLRQFLQRHFLADRFQPDTRLEIRRMGISLVQFGSSLSPVDPP